jgi:CBS domain-containing protein
LSDHDIVKVKDIMTKKITILSPDDGLDKATKLFEDPNHDGFPVVNEDGKLVGIVTAYDMVSQSYATHLPALLHILENVSDKESDGGTLKDQFEKMRTIKVRDMMNEDPLVVGPDVTVEDLAKEFIQHHRVNPIPVVDADKKLLGVVSRFDIIRFFDEKYLNKMLQESGHGGILQRLGRLD